ncbi:MAG: bactofilin family protein [Candidatus Caldatribacteriaceae bacterium]
MNSTNHSQEEIAVIGGNARASGQLEAQGLLIVEGEFVGSIRCPHLLVTKGGKVTGSIEVQELEVWGDISGFLRVQKMICRKASRIGGCVLARSIALEPGVFMEGFLTFQRIEDEHNERKESGEHQPGILKEEPQSSG